MVSGSGPVIEVGDGFRLERLTPSDRDALVEHMNDPEVARNLLAPPFPYTAEHADWWIKHRTAQSRDPESYFVVRDPAGQLIGAVNTVGELAPDAYHAEIGYWLARAFRGQGLMPRVLVAFAGHAFGPLKLHRLYAQPFTYNVASARALEKAGFQREGHLRQHYRKDGVYLDAFVYGLLASEWQNGTV